MKQKNTRCLLPLRYFILKNDPYPQKVLANRYFDQIMKEMEIDQLRDLFFFQLRPKFRVWDFIGLVCLITVQVIVGAFLCLTGSPALGLIGGNLIFSGAMDILMLADIAINDTPFTWSSYFASKVTFLQYTAVFFVLGEIFTGFALTAEILTTNPLTGLGAAMSEFGTLAGACSAMAGGIWTMIKGVFVFFVAGQLINLGNYVINSATDMILERTHLEEGISKHVEQNLSTFSEISFIINHVDYLKDTEFGTTLYPENASKWDELNIDVAHELDIHDRDNSLSTDELIDQIVDDILEILFGKKGQGIKIVEEIFDFVIRIILKIYVSNPFWLSHSPETTLAIIHFKIRIVKEILEEITKAIGLNDTHYYIANLKMDPSKLYPALSKMCYRGKDSIPSEYTSLKESSQEPFKDAFVELMYVSKGVFQPHLQPVHYILKNFTHIKRQALRQNRLGKKVLEKADEGTERLQEELASLKGMRELTGGEELLSILFVKRNKELLKDFAKTILVVNDALIQKDFTKIDGLYLNLQEQLSNVLHAYRTAIDYPLLFTEEFHDEDIFLVDSKFLLTFIKYLSGKLSFNIRTELFDVRMIPLKQPACLPTSTIESEEFLKANENFVLLKMVAQTILIGFEGLEHLPQSEGKNVKEEWEFFEKRAKSYGQLIGKKEAQLLKDWLYSIEDFFLSFFAFELTGKATEKLIEIGKEGRNEGVIVRETDVKKDSSSDPYVTQLNEGSGSSSVKGSAETKVRADENKLAEIKRKTFERVKSGGPGSCVEADLIGKMLDVEIHIIKSGEEQPLFLGCNRGKRAPIRIIYTKGVGNIGHYELEGSEGEEQTTDKSTADEDCLYRAIEKAMGLERGTLRRRLENFIKDQYRDSARFFSDELFNFLKMCNGDPFLGGSKQVNDFFSKDGSKKINENFKKKITNPVTENIIISNLEINKDYLGPDPLKFETTNQKEEDAKKKLVDDVDTANKAKIKSLRTKITKQKENIKALENEIRVLEDKKRKGEPLTAKEQGEINKKKTDIENKKLSIANSEQEIYEIEKEIKHSPSAAKEIRKASLRYIKSDKNLWFKCSNRVGHGVMEHMSFPGYEEISEKNKNKDLHVSTVISEVPADLKTQEATKVVIDRISKTQARQVLNFEGIIEPPETTLILRDLGTKDFDPFFKLTHLIMDSSLLTGETFQRVLTVFETTQAKCETNLRSFFGQSTKDVKLAKLSEALDPAFDKVLDEQITSSSGKTVRVRDIFRIGTVVEGQMVDTNQDRRNVLIFDKDGNAVQKVLEITINVNELFAFNGETNTLEYDYWKEGVRKAKDARVLCEYLVIVFGHLFEAIDGVLISKGLTIKTFYCAYITP